jgi:NAD(P)H-dependent FMN reductase
MIELGIIIGSTRPGRRAETVARWVQEIVDERDDVAGEVIDVAQLDLPHLDEPLPPAMGQYSRPHTRAWADQVARFDVFVFVTPEYNHSTSGVLKNAIDFVGAEWANKAAGFVSYGADGGTRAVEHLRLILANLQVATVRAQVPLSLFNDFTDATTFTPQPRRHAEVHTMLDQLVTWGHALQAVRAEVGVA